MGSYRLGTNDVSNPYFIVLHCPFNLLRMFREVKQNSCCWAPVRMLWWLVNLPYTNIHASYSQFSKFPSSHVNLTPEPDSTPIMNNCTILTSEQHGQKIPTSESPILASKSASSCENKLFVSSHSCHPPLREALQLFGWGANYVCVGS